MSKVRTDLIREFVNNLSISEGPYATDAKFHLGVEAIKRKILQKLDELETQKSDSEILTDYVNRHVYKVSTQKDSEELCDEEYLQIATAYILADFEPLDDNYGTHYWSERIKTKQGVFDVTQFFGSRGGKNDCMIERIFTK